MVTKICSHCFYTKTQHSKLSLLWVRWNFINLQAVFLNLQVNRIVWTQLYSVVHSQSRIHCQLFSRTMAHSAPNLSVSLFLWRQCNKWGKVEGPWREPCQIKKPFKGQRRRWGCCWEERKITMSSQWGVIELPSTQVYNGLQISNGCKLS